MLVIGGDSVGIDDGIILHELFSLFIFYSPFVPYLTYFSSVGIPWEL